MERSDARRRVIWGTAITANYVERARPFFRSVEANGGAFDRRAVVTVGFAASADLRGEFPSLEFSMLPETEPPNYGQGEGRRLIVCENEKCIIQQGEFLRALPSDPEDVILFTDSDMLMQRGPTEEEIGKLRSLGTYEVGVGPCAGAGRDSLMQEAARLYPFRPLPEIEEWLKGYLCRDNLGGYEVYCTGVVAATREAWALCLQRFIPHYPTMRRFFSHYARIQWLMSLIFDTAPFEVWPLPYEFTAHGCYGFPPGVTLRPVDGVAVSGGMPVMFRHAM